jgi:hypothetical protein
MTNVENGKSISMKKAGGLPGSRNMQSRTDPAFAPFDIK